MKEITGDIWGYLGQDKVVICITTNGTITKTGKGVMGAGVASQAAKKWPWIKEHLGMCLQDYGHRLIIWDMGEIDAPQAMCYFPVKHHWRDKADIELIKTSAMHLADMAARHPDYTYILPRPGCGKFTGKLSWEEVRPHLVDVLPDNVSVIDLP